MDFLSKYMLCIFIALPLASLLTVLICAEHTLVNVIGLSFFFVGYVNFVIWFRKRFADEIENFQIMICANLYSSKYLINGNALSKEDFDEIKEKNEYLYQQIMFLQCAGYCYGTCFAILEALKKGEIKFLAIKEITDEDTQNYYTMHVVYVNNDWCYDTYSQRQWPLEYFMKTSMAKSYKSFLYSDIEGKSYEEFIEEQAPILKKWCEENDCYEECSKQE